MTLPALSATAGARHILAFDGLDTYATVTLNGKVVLKSDNMFIIHRIDVTDHLHTSETNVLELTCLPALREAQKVKDAHPEHKWVGFNGDMARLAVRKAQYHFGWDWGPVLTTCGPWRAVRLETYATRIAELRVDYEVDASLKKVSGSITAEIEGSKGDQVRFSAKLGEVEVFRGEAETNADGHAQVDFHVNEPKLWYPHGYGAQPLYTITATLLSPSHDSLHTVSQRTGFRKGELIQEDDTHGSSFYFRINNIDVFCGGSDWIPADSFTPRISDERYRKWLQMMVDGNQLMIRIWGGGIWEEDVFYDACDELGVLVWQDFMFGCGNYPAHPEILESIEQESVCQTKRIRHHPSIVIYAGNNEDYQVQEQYDLTYDYTDKDPANWLKTDFPARYIYEKLLPDVIASVSPHVPYHPGSPWGAGKVSSDPTVGDMHQWNVWHGTQEKYQIYASLGGRFNSEFGLEAFPHLATIEHFCTDKSQLYPQSHVLDFHNKADGHERRIATYLVENFRTRTSLPHFIHLTQLSQAEAMSYGYRGWRKQWGEQRKCGGALVWQLNDCWPVTSWSIVDYFLRKKPAYYAMSRALAPVAIGVKREHWDWSVVHARPVKESPWECWVSSSRAEVIEGVKVEVRFLGVNSGKEVQERVVKEDVQLTANGTTDVFTGVLDNFSASEPVVLHARVWIDGKLVARDADWPQPLKYLDFGDRGLVIESEGSGSMRIRAEKPTKGLVFEEREGVWVEDSSLDVMPGDEQVVEVRGLKEGDAPLGWLYLGMDE